MMTWACMNWKRWGSSASGVGLGSSDPIPAATEASLPALKTHHAADRKVRADAMFLAVRFDVFERVHSCREQVVRIEFAKILPSKTVPHVSRDGGRRWSPIVLTS